MSTLCCLMLLIYCLILSHRGTQRDRRIIIRDIESVQRDARLLELITQLTGTSNSTKQEVLPLRVKNLERWLDSNTKFQAPQSFTARRTGDHVEIEHKLGMKSKTSVEVERADGSVEVIQ